MMALIVFVIKASLICLWKGCFQRLSKKHEEKICSFKKSLYLCGGIGEKSRSADALAYNFALNRSDLGNLFWNSSI